MTVQTFRELLARQPFQPFRLVMSGQVFSDSVELIREDRDR